MRVYKYGLSQPRVEAERVATQMRLAHVYQNQLIEIERHRREQVFEVLQTHPDVAPTAAEVEALTEELEQAVAALKRARAAARKRAEGAEDRARVRDLRGRLKDARARAREARRVLREDAAVQAALAAINEASAAAVREQRAASGLYWGTYLNVENAVDAARKSSTMPSFKRWNGNGAIAVQLQGGLDTVAVFGDDTRVRIDPVPEAAWHGRTRGERRRAARTRLHFRVGSDGRAPIWGVWDLIMHRPLPEGRIKWAKITRRVVGHRERWELHLTVDDGDAPQRSTAAAGSVVAVNLGWRALPRGLRVLYWRGSDGRHGEVLLDPEILQRIAKVRDLASIRSQNLTAMRERLHAWLETQREFPPWLVEAASRLGQWQSPGRFAALARRWARERWEGDAAGFEPLEAWRYRDEHLRRWEAGLRERGIGWRREYYRRIAARLASEYSTLLIGKHDLRRSQRRAAPEAETLDIDAVHARQALAAPSTMRLVLTQAFTARGGASLELDSANATQACHACGEVQHFDALANLRHTCSCGVVWDQDDNHCCNLLKRHGAASDTGTARVKDSTAVSGTPAPEPRRSGRREPTARNIAAMPQDNQ